jgi:hypothetical protein
MSKKNKTLTLFDDIETPASWELEWQDMPEFVQEDLTSQRKIVVHFRNDEDVKKFAELIGQRITAKQPSLWFPEMPARKYAHLRYTHHEK